MPWAPGSHCLLSLLLLVLSPHCHPHFAASVLCSSGSPPGPPQFRFHTQEGPSLEASWCIHKELLVSLAPTWGHPHDASRLGGSIAGKGLPGRRWVWPRSSPSPILVMSYVIGNQRHQHILPSSADLEPDTTAIHWSPEGRPRPPAFANAWPGPGAVGFNSARS